MFGYGSGNIDNCSEDQKSNEIFKRRHNFDSYDWAR